MLGALLLAFFAAVPFRLTAAAPWLVELRSFDAFQARQEAIGKTVGNAMLPMMIVSFAQQRAAARKSGFLQARYHSIVDDAGPGDTVADGLCVSRVFDVNPFEVGRSYRKERRAYAAARRRIAPLFRRNPACRARKRRHAVGRRDCPAVRTQEPVRKDDSGSIGSNAVATG